LHRPPPYTVLSFVIIASLAAEVPPVGVAHYHQVGLLAPSGRLPQLVDLSLRPVGVSAQVVIPDVGQSLLVAADGGRGQREPRQKTADRKLESFLLSTTDDEKTEVFSCLDL
jgi:hypothetical protein